MSISGTTSSEAVGVSSIEAIWAASTSIGAMVMVWTTQAVFGLNEDGGGVEVCRSFVSLIDGRVCSSVR